MAIQLLRSNVEFIVFRTHERFHCVLAGRALREIDCDLREHVD